MVILVVIVIDGRCIQNEGILYIFWFRLWCKSEFHKKGNWNVNFWFVFDRRKVPLKWRCIIDFHKRMLIIFYAHMHNHNQSHISYAGQVPLLFLSYQSCSCAHTDAIISQKRSKNHCSVLCEHVKYQIWCNPAEKKK